MLRPEAELGGGLTDFFVDYVFILENYKYILTYEPLNKIDSQLNCKEH